jgi:exopolysaccharide production protein ExoQ
MAERISIHFGEVEALMFQPLKQVFFHPAILPLVATIGIVYILLLSFWVIRKENKRSLLWIVTFLFLFTGLNLTISPFRYIYPEALADPAKGFGSVIAQLSIYACIVLVLRTWFKDFFMSILILSKNPFLFSFLILSLLSPFWSETPDLTLRYSAVVFFTSLFAVHVAREYSFQDLSDMLRRLTVVVGVVSLGFAAIAPSLAFNEKGLMGIMPFPIKLGTCLAFGSALWLSYALENRKDRWNALGIVGFLSLIIPLTNSAQAIFTYFILLALVILLKVLKEGLGKQYLPFLVIGFLMLGILISMVLQTLLPSIFNTLGKDMTLNGRTEFWAQLLDRLELHNLLLGYGLNGFWQPWRGMNNPAHGILNSGGFVPPHAHNGFLDVALSLGLIGFILFAISFLIVLSQSFQFFLRNKSADSSLPLIILLYILLSNLSETQLIGSNYIWILYVITLTRLNIREPRSLPHRSNKVAPTILSKQSYPTSLQNLNHN